VVEVWGLNLDLHIHMVLVLLPMMLSTWIRNLKYLVPLSSLANILILSGYIATIYIMCHDLPSISERRYVADWNMLPLFFGTVIYSFEGITLVRFLTSLAITFIISDVLMTVPSIIALPLA
jgi:proton-coupled amino acid transporter